MSSLRTLLLSIVFVGLAFMPLSGTRAATLTLGQIQAILSVLASFGVDASTVENIRAILEDKPNPHLPLSGNQTSYPSIVIFSPSPGIVTANTPLSISWQGIYGNSVYVLSLSPASALSPILDSVSVTASSANCNVGLSCSYTWTPRVSGASTTLTIRDSVSEKSGSVSPITFTTY